MAEQDLLVKPARVTALASPKPCCSIALHRVALHRLLFMTVGMAVQERAQLKERDRAMREAEEARKRTVRVTIDLLGRQVRSRILSMWA